MLLKKILTIFAPNKRYRAENIDIEDIEFEEADLEETDLFEMEDCENGKPEENIL